MHNACYCEQCSFETKNCENLSCKEGSTPTRYVARDVSNYTELLETEDVNIQLPNRERGSLVVIPHFDDEIFCSGSFLLTYKGPIILVVTHPTDCISKDTYSRQKDFFNESIGLLNRYRNSKNYPKIDAYVINGSNFNGVMNDGLRKRTHCFIESCLRSIKKVDTLITTIKSGHQSHRECNDIVYSMLRSPFFEKINLILLAGYPQQWFSIPYNESDLAFNYYIEMDDEQVSLCKEIIGVIYSEKNAEGSILGSDNFKKGLEYFGIKSGTPYSQPFLMKKEVNVLDKV